MATQSNSGDLVLTSSSPAELAEQLQSLVATRFTPEQRQLLHKTTQNIQRCARRRFSEDYELGKQLLTVKSFFPHGQRRLFVYWATQMTALGESMADRVQRIARAFIPFEETGQFQLLDRISAASLDRIAGHSVPRKARDAFFQKVLKGDIPTESEVTELVEAHRDPEDITVSEQFVRYSAHVSLWGTLRINEDGDEDYKFYLIDRNGVAHYLRHYKDLMTQYKAWRDRYMLDQFNQVQQLITPHWSIRHYPCPSLPYRVTVNCEMPNHHLSYTMANPIAVESWWYDRAQKWTKEQLEKQTAIQIEVSSVTEIASTVPVEFNPQLLPCCQNCDWHDATHESNTEGWIHCGFYNQPMQQERMYDMPLHCRKWRHPNAPAPEQSIVMQSEPIPEIDLTRVDDRSKIRENSVPKLQVAEDLPNSSLTLQEIKRFLLEAEMSDRELDELETIISQLKTSRSRLPSSKR